MISAAADLPISGGLTKRYGASQHRIDAYMALTRGGWLGWKI